MLLESAALHVGIVSGSSSPHPEPDAAEPLEEHASHAWTSGPRWRECARCAVRDYWRAACVPCAGRVPDGEKIPIDLAIDRIVEDLIAFRAWWSARSLDEALPSLAEWRAEVYEWSRTNGASAAPCRR